MINDNKMYKYPARQKNFKLPYDYLIFDRIVVIESVIGGVTEVSSYI